MDLKDIWTALTIYRCRLWLTARKDFRGNGLEYFMELPGGKFGKDRVRERLGIHVLDSKFAYEGGYDLVSKIEAALANPQHGPVRLIAPKSPLEAEFGAGLSVDQSGRERLPKGLPDGGDIDTKWISYQAFSRNQLSEAALESARKLLEQEEWDEGLERTRSMPLKRPDGKSELEDLPLNGTESLSRLAEFLKQVYSLAVIHKKPAGDEWHCQIAYSRAVDYLKKFPDEYQLVIEDYHPTRGLRITRWSFDDTSRWTVNRQQVHQHHQVVESGPSHSPAEAIDAALNQVRVNGGEFRFQEWPPLQYAYTVGQLRQAQSLFSKFPPDYNPELIWPEVYQEGI